MNNSTIKNEESIIVDIEYQCGDCKSWGVDCSRSKTGNEKSDKACIHLELKKSGVERIKKEIKKIKQSTSKKITVSDLCSDLVGKVVEVDVQVVGIQDMKALPKKVLITCGYCSNAFDIDLAKDKLSIEKKYIEKMIFENAKSVVREHATWRLAETVCDRGNNKRGHHTLIDITKYMDHSILQVRDILENIDWSGNQTNMNRKIYLINQIIPEGQLFNIKGIVTVEPDTKNITIIADKIEPLQDDFIDYKITEQDKKDFVKYFIDMNRVKDQISPDTTGQKRDIAKKSVALWLHSPNIIPDVNGNEVRGGLRIIFFGDSTCDKSRMAGTVCGKGNESYKFAGYFSGETGSRTGCLYTIDNDAKMLIWGEVVLNDRKALIMDGMQSIQHSEMKEMREVLRTRKVVVNRSIKGEAWARVRILGIFNPNKPMNQYLYPCQAIPDNYVFNETPEITRWDMFIPFYEDDVSKSDVANRIPIEKPIPDDVFKRHIFWVWSRTPEDIIIEDQAKEEIKKVATTLMEDYALSELPLINNGFREVLTRLSVSYACVEHSTDDTHEKVIVTSQHVKTISDFYKDEILDPLMLKEYIKSERGLIDLTDDEFAQINQDLGEVEYDILNAISLQSLSSTDLSAKLNLNATTIRKHYQKLRKYKLINTKSGKGATLSSRGVKFVRVLLKVSSLVAQTTTNSEKNDKLVADSTTELRTLKGTPPLQQKIKTEIGQKIVAQTTTNTQKEKVQYILNTIRDLDRGHGVFRKTILEFAKDDDVNITDFDIEKLVEGGILTDLNDRVRITEPIKSS